MAYIGKQEPEGRERNRGPKRRWTIPALPAIGAASGLDAQQILDEVPGALGVELWQLFRDAAVWNAVASEDRAGLFRNGTTHLRIAGVEEQGAQELGAALTVIRGLGEGARASGRSLARASRGI